MPRIFGTDGVRGLANVDITPELATGLAVAAARVLSKADVSRRRPFAVLGRDTRASGEFLEAAIVAGLASAGVDVVRLGVLPTPAVAHLAGAMAADLGVMISASHNAMPDNGIKFLAAGGQKLTDDQEDQIEALLDSTDWERPTGAAVGRVRDDAEAVQRYREHLLSTVGSGTASRPLRIVVDCAHGAASAVAPEVLDRLEGVTVVPICADPDGLNINEGCGSTHLGPLRAAVLEHDADAGFALDGDADRCLAVDAEGHAVDGDQILAILGLGLQEAGALPGNQLVATVMSNLGFVRAMEAAGITVHQAAVGDRYVLEGMKQLQASLGGEQSGHVIMSAHATTGDGTLTAVQLVHRMQVTGRSLADLASVVTRFPQVLINVPNVDKAGLADDDVQAAVRHSEERLGESGRVLLRASGTEPLIRVMVEAADEETARSVAHELADVVVRRLSLPA